MDRNKWKNKWAAENPEAYKKYQREYRQKRRLEDPEFRKRISKHSFKTLNKDGSKTKFHWIEHIPDNFLEMFNTQTNCEICKIEFNDKITKCLDHDHETGIARGALCRSCNHGLGQFRDNLQILNNAITYLQQHSKRKI